MELVMPSSSRSKLLGDYPYCTDFLLLPVVSAPGWPVSQGLVEHAGQGWPMRLANDLPDMTYDTIDAAERDAWESPEEGTLFWFRWVTGHQIAFLYWRCLATTLHSALMQESRSPDRSALSAAIQLMEGYSAMLVYAGSCPRELYTSSIRRFMYLAHKAFSGKWAVDYRLIPPLIKRAIDWEGIHGGLPPESGSLRSCFAENQRVHAAVAQKLVPDGESLRQEFRSEARTVSTAGPGEHERFDYFFLVKRGQPDAADLARALVKRQAVISFELGLNGVFPERFCNERELPPDLRGGPLSRYWKDLPSIVQAATRSAYRILSDAAHMPSSTALPSRTLPTDTARLEIAR